MSPRILSYLALGLGLGLIIALAISSQQSARAAYSFYSTYDTGPNGYRALFGLLRQEGATVERLQRPLGLRDPRIRTLVLSSNRADQIAGVSRSSFDSGDVRRLQAFVRGGGRLVLLDGPTNPLYAAFKIVPKPATNVSVLAPHLLPIAPVSATAGVRGIDVRGASLVPFTSVVGAIPLLGTSDGIAAFERRYGAGDVVAIAAPSALSNQYLAHASNARFAFNILAGHAPIAFDERLHGYAVNSSFWEALPVSVHGAIWIVVAMLVLWLVDANVRSAPALTMERLDERHSSSYVAAMAALLRRARGARVGIAGFYAEAKRRAESRRDRPGVALALEELARLEAMPRASDAMLLHAAQIAARLRKDLG